jgi:hypothetical protein
MDTLLSDALERGAFFGETHSIKGWLAAKRLVARFPSLLPLIGDLGQWNQLLSAPRVKGLFSEQVQWDMASVESRRLRFMMRGAVFPVSYAAACELFRREGLVALVEADLAKAVSRVGHLGHSFTIFCSFREIIPHLVTDHQRLLCAERYAEFVAAQLADTDVTRGHEEAASATSVDEAAVSRAVFDHPGYLGHTAITLAYALKARHELDEASVRHMLSRVQTMAVPQAADARDVADVEVTPEDGERELERAATSLLATGAREVHTLTLADAMCCLWDTAPELRADLLRLLHRFARLTLERKPGGERA